MNDNTAPPHQTFAQMLAQLTAPGAPFETETRDVDGRSYTCYKNAPASLADALSVGRAHGDATWLVFGDERWTFNDFFAASDAVAAQLRDEYGVRSGQRVAIAMRNYPEWMAAFNAVASLGAAPVCINSWSQTPELIHMLEDSKPQVLFCDQRRFDMLAEHLQATSLPTVVARPEKDNPGARDWAALREAGAGAAAPEIEPPAADDEAMLMYTSGTTSRPKGVRSLHRQLCQAIFNFECVGAAMGMTNGDIMQEMMTKGDDFAGMLAVPLFHVSGCHAVFFLNLRGGRRTVMMYKWDIKEALKLVEEQKIGILSLAPAMMIELLESPEFSKHDTSSLFWLGAGGSASPLKLANLIEKRFPNRLPGSGYGATETNASVFSMNGHIFRARPKSCGLRSPITEVEIRDPDSGETLPQGERGEVWVYGVANADGYWQRPEETAHSFHDGWFRTGDIGYLDEDGYAYIVDRIKDVIIRGGENISAQEVEHTLGEHPQVADSAVCSIPHERLGEEPAALVRRRDGADLSEQALRDFAAERLAAYKVPARIRFTDQPLPRNAAGKLLKKEIRQIILAEK